MEGQSNWELPQRQPAAAVVVVIFRAITNIIKMLWPALVAILFSRRKEGGAEKWIIISSITIGASVVFAAFEFLFFRFFVSGNELIIRKGFFNKREIVLPLHRIQSIHLDQDWLHRLLNIVKVSIDSPGASKAEVKFSLKRPLAEAFRNHILNERGVQREENISIETRPLPVLELSGADLLKLGISANFLKAFFLMLAFLISMLDNLEAITGRSSSDWILWVGDKATASSASLLAAFAVIVLLFSVTVSFLMVVLKYGNFRMDRTQKGFHIKSGLLNRREKAITFNKLQFISWKANWIRRHIPYYLMQFHAIGEIKAREKLDINVPVTNFKYFKILLEDYHPLPDPDLPVVKIHHSYFLRRSMIAFLVISAISALLWFFVEWYSLWVYILFPVLVISYFLFQKKFKAIISASAVYLNKEVFGKESILLRWDKVQSVTITQSIYQRRRKVATLRLNTAGGNVNLPFISILDAQRLRDYAIFTAENSPIQLKV